MRDFEAMIREAVQQAVRAEFDRLVNVELPAAVRRALHPRWCSARTLSRLLDLSERQVRYLAQAGKLPYVRVAGSVRFDLGEVEKAISEGRVPARWRYHEEGVNDPSVDAF